MLLTIDLCALRGQKQKALEEEAAALAFTQDQWRLSEAQLQRTENDLAKLRAERQSLLANVLSRPFPQKK